LREGWGNADSLKSKAELPVKGWLGFFAGETSLDIIFPVSLWRMALGEPKILDWNLMPSVFRKPAMQF
jgi:hypothetical protein